MLDVLQPRRFASHPARNKVTRTIRQPDADEFDLDQQLGLGGGDEEGKHRGRTRSAGRGGMSRAKTS